MKYLFPLAFFLSILSAPVLAGEISFTSKTIDISPYKVARFYSPVTNAEPNTTPMVFITPGNKKLLAWNDHNFNFHLSFLKGGDVLRPSDIFHRRGYRLENAIFHDGHVVALLAKKHHRKFKKYYQYWKLYIVKINMQGGVVFMTKVIGGDRMQRAGDRIYYEDQQAYLAFNGSVYGVLTARLQMSGRPLLGHHLDLFKLFDRRGRLFKGEKALASQFGWSSHSFKLRLMSHGKTFYYGTSCDAHPGRGILVGAYPHFRYKNIHKSRGRMGDNDMWTHLGDMLPHAKGALMIYDAENRRRRFDLVLVYVTPEGVVSPKRWISKNRNTHARTPRMIPYGENFFITWVEHPYHRNPGQGKSNLHANQNQVKSFMAVVDKMGRFVSPPRQGEVFRANLRLFNYPNGAVGWVNDVKPGVSHFQLYKTAAPPNYNPNYVATEDLDSTFDRWKMCLNQYGMCHIPGDSNQSFFFRSMRNERWKTVIQPGGKKVRCKNNEICQTKGVRWVKCAGEFQTCSIQGSSSEKYLFKYGPGNRSDLSFYSKVSGGFQFKCDNSQWGDPAPNVHKACYYIKMNSDQFPGNIKYK